MPSLPAMIWKEMRFRSFSTLLGVLTVTTAVGLVVLFLTTAEAAERATRRVQRDLGLNLRIVPARTDPEEFWLRGYSDHTMPDTLLKQLAARPNVSINHLVGVLQRPVRVGTTTVLLTGVTASVNTPGRAEARMRQVVKPGTVELGFEAARLLKLGRGDALELNGHRFVVAQTLLEKGTEEDLRVYGNLADVQKALGLPGQVNEIRAIDCLCLLPADEPLEQLRRELGPHLSGARILLDRDRAAARAAQRQLVEGHMGFLIPAVLVGAAVCVAALTMSNVRSRWQEVGLLRALGRAPSAILILFIGKALAVGLAGAALGCAAGTALAVWCGPDIFQLSAAAVRPLPGLILLAMLLAPAVTALASLAPAMLAATLDPADVLRGE
jgi:cell division protein FtsX